jgi:hypothetical protein
MHMPVIHCCESAGEDSQEAWTAQNPLHAAIPANASDPRGAPVDVLHVAAGRDGESRRVLLRAVRNSVVPFVPTQTRKKAIR